MLIGQPINYYLDINSVVKERLIFGGTAHKSLLVVYLPHESLQVRLGPAATRRDIAVPGTAKDPDRRNEYNSSSDPMRTRTLAYPSNPQITNFAL